MQAPTLTPRRISALILWSVGELCRTAGRSFRDSPFSPHPLLGFSPMLGDGRHELVVIFRRNLGCGFLDVSDSRVKLLWRRNHFLMLHDQAVSFAPVHWDLIHRLN